MCNKGSVNPLVPKPLFFISLRLGFDDEQRRSSDVERSPFANVTSPGNLDFIVKLPSLGLDFPLKLINASLYCSRVMIYMSSLSNNTLFISF